MKIMRTPIQLRELPEGAETPRQVNRSNKMEKQ